MDRVKKTVVVCAILGVLLAEALMTCAVAGYYRGIAHAVEDMRVWYDAGEVILELDGQSYAHFAEEYIAINGEN